MTMWPLAFENRTLDSGFRSLLHPGCTEPPRNLCVPSDATAHPTHRSQNRTRPRGANAASSRHPSKARVTHPAGSAPARVPQRAAEGRSKAGVTVGRARGLSEGGRRHGRGAAGPARHHGEGYASRRVLPRRAGSVSYSFRAAVNCMMVFFASPRTIMVFGFTNSSFSIPAKPGLSERFSTMHVLAWSAPRMGMP